MFASVIEIGPELVEGVEVLLLSVSQIRSLSKETYLLCSKLLIIIEAYIGGVRCPASAQS